MLACGRPDAQAADMKLQAFLLWGTDESKPPAGKAYQPVEPTIRLKLKDLPLKWTNWFEVNRKEFVVVKDATKEVPISEKCRLNVKGITGPEARSHAHRQRERGRPAQAVPPQGRDARPGRQCPQFHRLAGRPQAAGMKVRSPV